MKGFGLAYMIDLLHNFHLILNLLVQNTILHKPPLIEFLCCVRRAVVFGGNFMNGCKCPFPDDTNSSVFIATAPLTGKTAQWLLDALCSLGLVALHESLRGSEEMHLERV